MFKNALYVVVPVLAALSPIAIFSAPSWWSKVTASLSSSTAEDPNGPADFVSGSSPGAADLPALGPAGVSPQNAARPGDVPFHDLADAFRFDLTPDWIVANWPRVSAGLAYLELQGYRVPLVTGTAEDDVAGAVTYYFNPRQQLQRITFQGTTGSPQKLVDLVTTRFGFARRLANDASVYLYEIPGAKGKATSFLWVRPASVVKASDPHRRFEVALVIERPKDR
jgi:hypothetical protein